MNYTATVYDKDGGVAGPFNAISELFLDAPENVLNVSMTETNYIKDDWQVAVYSDTPYLEVKVGDKGTLQYIACAKADHQCLSSSP